MEETTHELVISEEAKFDYAFINDLLVGDFGSDLPPRFRLDPQIKEETEVYITNQKRIWFKHYLRLTYLDEKTGKDLMLFILRREHQGNIQKWELVGICEKQYWSEDAEEYGMIRNWYNFKIDKLPKERDWVLIQYTYNILDKLEEIRDIGEYDDYIEAREIIARELSKQQIEGGRIVQVEPGRIKYFLKNKYYNSRTANEIIRQLDSLIDGIGARISEQSL